MTTWIKADERLPDEGEPVFIHEPGCSLRVACRVVDSDGWYWAECYAPKHDGAKWCCDDCEGDDYQPTHWMPFPEPPQVTR